MEQTKRDLVEQAAQLNTWEEYIMCVSASARVAG